MQTVYLPKAHTYCLGVNVMNRFYSVTVKKVKCVSILPSVSFERFIYIYIKKDCRKHKCKNVTCAKVNKCNTK